MNCSCHKDFPYSVGDTIKVVRQYYWHPDVEIGDLGKITQIGFGIHQPGFWLVWVEFDGGNFVSDMSLDEIEIFTVG